MQIIFGEKCVSLLRLFFAAVLMLWCAQTAAYSGQCHTTQGNPYIGVNFGVKTLEEEANTAGNDSNLLIVFYVQIMPDDFVMQLHRF